MMALGRFPWTRPWAARGGPAADPPWGTWATPDILFSLFTHNANRPWRKQKKNSSWDICNTNTSWCAIPRRSSSEAVWHLEGMVACSAVPIWCHAVSSRFCSKPATICLEQNGSSIEKMTRSSNILLKLNELYIKVRAKLIFEISRVSWWRLVNIGVFRDCLTWLKTGFAVRESSLRCPV